MKRWIVILLAMGCGGRMDLGSVGTGDASDTSASDAATMGCAKPPWIVFDYDDPVTNEYRIYAMHPDGSSPHAVDLDGKRGTLPSVSPDGTKLLYVQFVNSDETLMLRDLATQTSTVLDWPTTVIYYWSAVSPDDQLVVYSNAYGNLYAVSADGTGQHLLAQPSNGVAGFPVFSTDSATVYFEAGGSLESIRTDSTDLQVLTSSKTTDMVGDGLALSPDGTKLARRRSAPSAPRGAEHERDVTPSPSAWASRHSRRKSSLSIRMTAVTPYRRVQTRAPDRRSPSPLATRNTGAAIHRTDRLRSP